MKFDFDKTYEHIGYLSYALLKRHNAIDADSLTKLTDFIERVWKPPTNGDHTLHRHLIDCIHQGIKYAIDNKMSAQEAFESFRTYFLIHSLAFGSELRGKVLSSAELIIKEFPGDLPSEVERELHVVLESPPARM